MQQYQLLMKNSLLVFLIAAPFCCFAQNTIWYSDVSTCSDWDFGNGSLESGMPWQGITIDFECSTVGPAGPYNSWAGGNNDGTPAPAIQSTTNSNGFLLIDSDEWGSVEGYDAAWVENSWVQTVAPIDCSTHDYVALEFETRYRCFDNGASDGSEKCFIEISRDGYTWPTLTQNYVTTWEDEGMVDYGNVSAPDSVQCRYEVFPESQTGYETDNPSLIELDITAAAGGQSEVWIRFRWVGTWGYSWEIDDIKVVEILENDTRIDNYVSYTNYLQTGIYENGTWAQSQLLDTLSAGARVYNFGYGTQENVVLDIEVNGNTYSSEVIETFPNAVADTLSAGYFVSDVGTYTVNYALSSSNGDNNLENNFASQSFEVTEYSYGRDNGVLFDVYGGGFEYACMPYYNIHNDVIIYGIDVAIMAGSTEGSPISAWIIDIDDDINIGGDGYFSPPFDMDQLATSGVTSLNPDVSWSGEGDVVWYTFEFEDPYVATAGQVLGAAFEYFGGAELTIAESSANFESAAIYGPAGADNSYAWRRTSDMPMVRLNLDPAIVATEPYNPTIFGCTDVNANNWNPNANADDGSCEYTILGCTDFNANNFNPEATTNDGSCEYFQTSCAYLGDPEWDNIEPGLYAGEPLSHVIGASLTQEVVLHVPDVLTDPATGTAFAVMAWENLVVSGMPEGLEFDNLATVANGNSQSCLTYSGTPLQLGVFDVDLTGEMVLNFFGSPFPVGPVTSTLTIVVESNPNPIAGCTYDHAENYMIIANVDDGSCVFAGCTDPNASNFDPTASIDDGSCDDAPCEDGNALNFGDLDSDGIVGTADLLALLGVFGVLYD